jgi:hypothetical protein
MKFKEIKSTISEIYNSQSVPKVEQVETQRNGIRSFPQRFYGNKLPYNYHALLAKEKDMEGRELDLRQIYWDFAADIFNSSKHDIGSVKKLLEDKCRELERAYFVKTNPIKEFFIHDEIGKKIFDRYPDDYRALTGHLCSMDIYYFHEVIQENEFIYDLFTDLETLRNIPGHTGGDRQFFFFMNHAKEIRLWYAEAQTKLYYMKKVLNQGLFGPWIKEINGAKKWDKLTKEEQREVGNSQFKENEVDMPEGFRKKAHELKAELKKKSQYTQENLILDLIDSFDELHKSNCSTIYRRLKKFDII